ncbi:hypothetical protein [Thermovibrio sp.]
MRAKTGQIKVFSSWLSSFPFKPTSAAAFVIFDGIIALATPPATA